MYHRQSPTAPSFARPSRLVGSQWLRCPFDVRLKEDPARRGLVRDPLGIVGQCNKEGGMQW